MKQYPDWVDLEACGWVTWDGDYDKVEYLLLNGSELVLCWPNAGRMYAIDGSGRSWGPEDSPLIREANPDEVHHVELSPRGEQGLVFITHEVPGTTLHERLIQLRNPAFVIQGTREEHLTWDAYGDILRDNPSGDVVKRPMPIPAKKNQRQLRKAKRRKGGKR